MTQWNTPVWVIADDFTGANDAGAGLARAGARVNVLFDSDSAIDRERADVWVINTDSRALGAQQAADRTRKAAEIAARSSQHGWIFKKIDSTLRGNPGAEIEAALLASGKPLALVVAAVPRLARTTRDGLCRVDGRLLTETEFASDPKTPVSDASILARLQAQSSLTGAVLTLDKVRSEQLLSCLQQQIERGTRLLVVDSESDNDIQRVMQAAAQLAEKPLLAGAAGLSDALAAMLSRRPAAPLLAVIGSMSEISRQQIARLEAQHPLALIDIDVQQLFQQPAWPDSCSWLKQAVSALQLGRHCVMRTGQQPEQRHSIAGLCQQHQLSRAQLGEKICQQLAELTAGILQQVQPAGLYLSGGDVALAIARRLGASGFQINGQVAGCVPYGHLLNAYQNMLVMTKAGGFGDENTLVEIIRFIEEKSSE